MESAEGDYLRRNAYNIITEVKQNRRVVTTQHSTISYKISSLKKCFKKHNNIILNSLSKFREKYNINQYIYSFYQMMEDTIINQNLKVGIYSVKPKKIEKIINSDFKNLDFVCLNDEYEMTDQLWKVVASKFQKLLPKKSKYEI